MTSLTNIHTMQNIHTKSKLSMTLRS